jgi:hypothetical protein
MPLNVSYLEIRDDNKNIIDYYYVGIINYKFNNFSLEHFIYTICNNELYKEDIKIYDNKSSFSIWNNNTINKIKKMLEHKPLTNLEKEAYEHTKKVIDWIEKKDEQYKDKKYHFLFISHFNI